MKWVKTVFLFTLIACTHKTPQQKLAEFLDDPRNKIKQRITVGDVTLTMRWMPPICREAMNGGAEKDREYDYFDIKFDRAGDDKIAKEKILYLDFDMQKNFTMAVGTDSLSAVICQRIPNGRHNSYEYMLAFQRSADDQRDFTVVYRDEIFGIGSVIFVYKGEDLKKIPTLAAK